MFRIYNLYGPMLITSYKIVDAISDKYIYIYAKFEIHGVTDPFTINSTNIFRHKYEVHGKKNGSFI